MTKDYHIQIWDNTAEGKAHEAVLCLFKQINLSVRLIKNDSTSLYFATMTDSQKMNVLEQSLPIIHQSDCMLRLQELSDGKTFPIECFACDLDGTLIQEEMLVLLARIKGIEKKMQEQTSLAVLGQKPFSESFSERVALLKGLSRQTILQASKELNYARGAIALIKHFQKFNFPTALISSNLSILVQSIAQKLKFDYYSSSQEVFDEYNQLKGSLKSLVDSKGKALFLENLLHNNGISPKHCLVIGDGTNDLEMLSKVGHSVLCSASSQIPNKQGQLSQGSPFSWLSLI